MIIKYGVADNDFGVFLYHFGKDIGKHLRRYKYEEIRTALKNEDAKLYVELTQERDDFLKAINVNNDEPLSEETKAKIYQVLTEQFSIEAKKREYQFGGDNTSDYLIKNFTVEVVDCVRDEWANGEENYYIQSNNVVITL